jgi:hypothetical protein
MEFSLFYKIGFSHYLMEAYQTLVHLINLAADHFYILPVTLLVLS